MARRGARIAKRTGGRKRLNKTKEKLQSKETQLLLWALETMWRRGKRCRHKTPDCLLGSGAVGWMEMVKTEEGTIQMPATIETAEVAGKMGTEGVDARREQMITQLHPTTLARTIPALQI